MLLLSWAYEQTFFPSAERIFPFSNPNPFPFEPKETKIREDNFSEMKEREESSSIFVVGERIYNVKFNMNAQTWLLIHYWLFLLEYFFSSQRGPWSKRLCRPYAYEYQLSMLIWMRVLPSTIFFSYVSSLIMIQCKFTLESSIFWFSYSLVFSFSFLLHSSCSWDF